jgi:ABC-type nickel/cobalt efflux system permease component RcnA
MMIAQESNMLAWQVLVLLFAGAVFGFIAAWLLWIFWWAERREALKDRGNRYRERIQGRFDHLHEARQKEHQEEHKEE